jgi:hypothetical protein
MQEAPLLFTTDYSQSGGARRFQRDVLDLCPADCPAPLMAWKEIAALEAKCNNERFAARVKEEGRETRRAIRLNKPFTTLICSSTSGRGNVIGSCSIN